MRLVFSMWIFAFLLRGYRVALGKVRGKPGPQLKRLSSIFLFVPW